MASRVLLQRRLVAPLAATMVLGGLALQPQTIHAEAPPSDAVSKPVVKKPIYEEPSPVPSSPYYSPPSHDTPTEERKPRRPTPTDRLAVQIGHARLFLYRQALRAENAVNGAVDSAFHLEKSFTNTIASLAPAAETGEKIMPGAIYVLVAAMAGNIVTRNRGFALRATLPVALGIGAGWVVLPATMTNVSNLAWKYEERVPALAEAHLKTRESIKSGTRFVKVHKDLGVRYVTEEVTKVRLAVEDWMKKGK